MTYCKLSEDMTYHLSIPKGITVSNGQSHRSIIYLDPKKTDEDGLYYILPFLFNDMKDLPINRSISIYRRPSRGVFFTIVGIRNVCALSNETIIPSSDRVWGHAHRFGDWNEGFIIYVVSDWKQCKDDHMLGK